MRFLEETRFLKSSSLPQGRPRDDRSLEEVIHATGQETASPLESVVGKLSFHHEALADFFFHKEDLPI